MWGTLGHFLHVHLEPQKDKQSRAMFKQIMAKNFLK